MSTEQSSPQASPTLYPRVEEDGPVKILVAGAWFTVFERGGKHFIACDMGELFGRVGEYALTPMEAAQTTGGDEAVLKVLQAAQSKQQGRFVHAIPMGAVHAAVQAAVPTVSVWPVFLRRLWREWRKSWWVCRWWSDDPSGIIQSQGGEFVVFADSRDEANAKAKEELPDVIWTAGKRTLLVKWKVRRPYVWERVRSLF